MTYPKDPIEARFERDVHFRHLVGMLEAMIQTHQFSPSELRDACMLAATRYEMRTTRSLVFSDGEIYEFLRRTDRNEADERAIDARDSNERTLVSILANLPRDHD